MSDIVEFPVEEAEEEFLHHRLTLDPSRLSYQEYADFLNAYSKGDMERAFPIIMTMLVAWTYDIPISPNAYEELSFTELPFVATSVNDTLKAYVLGLDTSRVTVDLRKWSMKDYFAFREAARVGDVKALEAALLKVARIKDDKPGKRLSFEQGALISKAVNDATQRMFGAGK